MGDEQNALPASPPIFVPAAVTSARAERAPWVGAAAGLSVIGLPITLGLAFGTRDGAFERWTWQPFVPAAGWGVLVMALAAVPLAVPRGTGRVKAAILGSALLIVSGLVVAAAIEQHTRSHIVPRLVTYSSGLPAPTGFVTDGPPRRIRVTDRDGNSSFHEPTIAVAWKTQPATDVCPLLKRQLTAATGWQVWSPGTGCEFVRTSGRIRVDVSSGLAGAKPQSTALVKISANDGWRAS